MNASPIRPLGMILKGYPRISETFISNEILLLERLGFDVHIFSMRKPRETFSHKSVEQISAGVDYLPERLIPHIHRLFYHNACLAGKRPDIYARGLRIAFRRFSRTRKLASIKHLFQAGYLVHRLLLKTPCGHIHAHFAHSPTSVAFYTSLLSGLSFSFTAHAKDIYTSDPLQLREKIEAARFVVTCTEYNKRHLTALAPRGNTPIHRIYHGIDIDLFSPANEEKRPANSYEILTVARLTSKKGIPTVFKAIRFLHDKGFRLRHTLIGDGEDRQKNP